ncbi:MAG: uroporphyrinogen decarboxylase family protein [Bryobacteraceae bacterium]
MTRRERLLAALNHQQPDRVPMDLGATGVTGIHASVVAALRDYYGLEKRPVKVHDPHQMLGLVEEDLAEAMGVDVAGVPAPRTLFGFPARGWKPFRLWNEMDLAVPAGFNTTVAANGDLLMYPQGDISVAPSGRMPKGGWFFDSISRQEPIDEERLDPADNLEEFGPIADDDLGYYRGRAAEARSTGRGVIANTPGTALGDIALVPAPFLKHPKGIRDVTEWYVSTRSRRDYIHRVFAKQVEYALTNLARIHGAVGDDAFDAVFTCGTDFGTQTSSFCSVATFHELWLPCYREINGWIHKNTRWKTFKHSCGAVGKFIPSFIDAGFDILNPVQCSASGMDARRLKSDFGSALVFWGGGVDTQKTLPFGTPEDVRREVLERCEIFAAGGGFVFNTIHNVQAGTPVANVVALIEAVGEFNGRS